MSDAGKGHVQRPLSTPKTRWDTEYERIFGRKERPREAERAGRGGDDTRAPRGRIRSATA